MRRFGFVAAAGAVAACAWSASAGGPTDSSLKSPVPGEANVLRGDGGTRFGFVVWDQGYPDTVNGNEMTLWNQGENFSLGGRTILTGCVFWTLDCGKWDGTLEWAIWDDAGGVPGALRASGATGLSRFYTGRDPFGCPEYDNFFNFPGGTTLDAGNYILTLHMSSDCGTRDEIYWETSAFGGPPPGVEQGNCAGAWVPAFGDFEHAFILIGKPDCPLPTPPSNPSPANGATGLPLNVKLSWGVFPCVTPGLANGGFETGDFTGWTPVAIVPPNGELQSWNVSSGGTGWFGNAFPWEGAFYAQNGFDGDAGLHYELYQEVLIPAFTQAAVLSWVERIQWDSLGIPSTLPRKYRVSVQPAGGGAPLAVLHEFSFIMNGSPYTDTGYVYHAVDLAQLGISGNVRLVWEQDIPEFYTGPAQIEFDAISLGCENPQQPAARRGVSPERKKMSDEAFARKVAAYEAVRNGEFRSPAEAMASGRFDPPKSDSAIPHEGVASPQPLKPTPLAERGAALLFNGGGPNRLYGNEMTLWRQAEDFYMDQNSNVKFLRFWTLEVPGAWDGVCEVAFHPDAGGVPGAPYYSAPAVVLSRAATGFDFGFGLFEYEYLVSLPGAPFVPTGFNWVSIHMSGDCGTRDEVYWESTSAGFGASGHEFFACAGAPAPNYVQHAFELYGNPVDCPTTYYVYLRALSPGGGYELMCITGEETCEVFNLVCDTEYEWIVIACNPNGNCVYGPFWRFRTRPCCCEGDANGDGVVNFADITNVLQNWLRVCPK